MQQKIRKVSLSLLAAGLYSCAVLAQQVAQPADWQQVDKPTSAHNHSHDASHRHDHSATDGHAEDEFTQLGTHVHGIASLTLVLEGNELQLALQSAAANIVGFEHAPRTAEQKQEIAIALEHLMQGLWFSVSAEANCEIQSSDASTDLTEAAYHGHGDFYANLSLLCQRPAMLKGIALSLFNLTPSLDSIDVQWVINGRQGAAKASLTNNQIQF